MQDSVGVFLQSIFGGLFFLTLLVGAYLFKNDKVLFGPDRKVSSETESARSYNRMQVWVILVHLAIFLGLFAIFLR
jgi:hypothetical protein